MSRLIRQREKLLLFNQKYWGKLSRKNWLVQGDRNTSFFQHQARLHKNRKTVIQLKDSCGVWINDPVSISQVFVEDFTRRFKSSHPSGRELSPLGLPHLISDMDNQNLIKMPTLEDVHTALFSMDSNKTPGPDGFGAGFFKTYWPLLKSDLFNSVVEFFRTGKLLKEINHTFLTLIPKISLSLIHI